MSTIRQVLFFVHYYLVKLTCWDITTIIIIIIIIIIISSSSSSSSSSSCIIRATE